MISQYHILNGDALKAQFPGNISGILIVARECLVDGPVDGSTLRELYTTRAKFLEANYGGLSKQKYSENSESEFIKVQNIPAGAEINLWFEDDLFCQVNLWFMINLLHSSNGSNAVFLVRPKEQNQYGFGGLNQDELNALYNNRIVLNDIDKLANFWIFYQQGNTGELLEAATELIGLYPFLLPAVKAHIERLPSNDDLMGRPKQSLLRIMTELKTRKFDDIFQEFSKRESIYGFGDLQVKRLLDELSDHPININEP